MRLWKSKIWRIAVYAFAAIGFVFTFVFAAMQFGLLNVRGSNAARNASLGITAHLPQDCTDGAAECDWSETGEWATLSAAFTKDRAVIERAARDAGVSPRLIMSTVAPEQIRFFTSDREKFKSVFEPLKILVSLSKFSLGVSGIKEDTANQIEQYANDPSSPFYPGPDAAALIAYDPGASHDTELYNRLTDEHDHYYSYLYTALFIKEIENQWFAAGFDISTEPGIIATLFNLGFKESAPHPEPQVAGAAITLGDRTYTYGQLGQLIYGSAELPEFAK